jgi:acyl-CoA hydrolase
MVSVNTALEVDLFDQANAAYRRGTVYSGLGGQADFVVGALHAPAGQAIIALRSWHPRADRSTIVDRLDEPVTSFQHTAVVTEHGTAELVGRSQDEQRRNLVEHAAHPRARESLRAAARSSGDVTPVRSVLA